MKLLLVAAAALAVASCATISSDELEFHAWKVKFEKSYISLAEEAQRKEIWLNNRRLVLEHNIMADQGIKSYRLGMTTFADMENEEYRRMISQGCVGFFNTSLHKTGSAFLRLPEGIDLPTSVDWRDEGYVTEVKNQKQCGSCWAFSATGSLEGQNYRKTGMLVSLSAQQLVDCSNSNYGCKGGWMNNAFWYISTNGGIESENSYPYEAMDGMCRHNPAYSATTCTGFVNLNRGDEAALEEAVATVGPVSVAIDASHPTFQLYHSGLYDEPACSSTLLNHAVLVVGYDSRSLIYNRYWLVKNSWGLGWGEQGYIRMSKDKYNQCGIATTASYPLV
ncbi:hypothetical protein PBY51_010784 [Eleginops maclovinus]|nr:hypothetical protein PBY51_010784 [Eleginops maclovinus]